LRLPGDGHAVDISAVHPFMPLPALEPDSEFYWRAARAGRLEMARCQTCGWWIHPARPVCARCRSRDVKPEVLSGDGVVWTYTINHQVWMPGLEVPYVVAVVALAEQENLRLTTNIVDCAPEDVRIGMPVRVRFREVSDEIALPVFAPADDPVAPPPTHVPLVTDTASVAARPLRRVSDAERLERRAIISGVGQSAIGRRLMRTDMDLTVEAALRAIADAGLEPDDVDGIASYPGTMVAGPAGFAGPGVIDVQDALGLSCTWHQGGIELPGQLGAVIAATLAVAAGLARHVLVYRTVTEASAMAGMGRRGIGAGSREIPGFAQYLIPYGAMSAANWIAAMAMRHMHEFGTTREQLGEIAMAARRHAARNPDAVYRAPMSLDDYLAARLVSWPFGLFDCDAPCDGSTALIVSHADVARDLPKPAVRVNAVGTAMRSRPSWDQWQDLTTMAARDAAAQLWTRTELTPADVDCAQLYDGFSFLALAWIEALGFCPRGEGGRFVQGGTLDLGGALPCNTWGGQLSGGRLHGFGFLAEAVRQLRGEAGPRQVADCEVVAVANGGGPIAGCMLLTR
jgi:acetyl-CoA acetyltransferase/uncharacterized OB-fold protein